MQVLDIPYHSRYANKEKVYRLDVSKIEYVKTTSSNITIYSDEIRKLCVAILSSKQVMLDSLSKIYQKFVAQMHEKSQQMCSTAGITV